MEIKYNHDSLHRKLCFADVKEGQFFKYKPEHHNSHTQLYLRIDDNYSVIGVDVNNGLFYPTNIKIDLKTPVEEIYEGTLALSLISKAW